MGFFDFFKRKDTSTLKTTQNSSASEVYKVASKYNEYTKLFVNMMVNGNYAPIAAYEKLNGEIIGYLYVTKDESYMLSVEDVIAAMKEEFASRLDTNTINSYAIYYHSLFNNDNNHTAANEEQEPKAVSIILKDKNAFSTTIAVPYTFEGEGFSIGPMTDVTNEEYRQVLQTDLQEGKDYFQERIEREPKMIENEAGITIKTVNNGKVGDFWGGMLGFEFFRSTAPDMLMQYIALAQTKDNPIKVVDNVKLYELAFDKLSLRVISTHENVVSAFPTVQTNYSIDVEHTQIDEWEHSNNLEAIVYGKGRDTFAIRYYATDYSVNRAKYTSQKQHRVQLSAILYVLDIPEEKKGEKGDLKFSDDFCMYMPSQEHAAFGCFDFEGILEDLEEATYFDMKEHSGYILKIRLVNHEEIEDFFTLDMFINQKNMRFSDLIVGMKLTGMFQLLGEIAE
ncbi:hypothetical protein H2O64_12745 [Kordia sp. YSTF-M3]|uniref:Uncharacterized protein n=1 Tax=Kordia aestuariivivens TaxID=2759037 RepID=A0ABR7QAH1_9FLAO|nr:hypothetical protein [Kordia aestuariivivens]MBC8755538.1 hypothetical protein [Kordia aestuariivivens]